MHVHPFEMLCFSPFYDHNDMFVHSQRSLRCMLVSTGKDAIRQAAKSDNKCTSIANNEVLCAGRVQSEEMYSQM